MAINTFKPQPNYSSLRRKRRFKGINKFDVPDISGSKNILLGVLAFMLLALGVFGILRVLTSDYFEVEEIHIVGLRSIPIEDFNQDLSSYYSQNIFFTNSQIITSTLMNKYPSF